MAKCDRRGIFSCVFVLVLSMANAVLAESVTVHVPEGDVTLDEALRKGYAGTGVDYDALISADDLVVTGPGRLIVDKDLAGAGYRGEVHVKKGSTLRVTVSGALGDTEKGTFVEKGATLETFAESGDNSLSFRYEPLTFEGSGTDGQGALVALSANQRTGAWGGTVLEMSGDALIRVACGGFVDFPVQSPRSAETIDMNGHTLAICGSGTADYATLPVRMNVIDPGHIVVSNKLLISVDDQNNLGGSPENTLTLGQTAKLDLYRSNSSGKKFWTLKVSPDAPDNAIVSSAGGVWDGPVEWKDTGRMFLAMATDKESGNVTAFAGGVDVPGDWDATNNTKSANRGWPTPFLSLRGEDNRVGGTLNLMELDAEIGETNPQIGKIRLYKSSLALKNSKHSMDRYGNAGLWKGTKGFSVWSGNDPNTCMSFFKGSECITNSAALGADDAMTSTAANYGEHTVVTYSGYIWNNDYNTSSRVITFVNNSKTASDISIVTSEGNIYGIPNYQGDSEYKLTGIRLPRGANKIEIRLAIYNGKGGANGKFSDMYGIMYRWGSSTSDSTDPADYSPLMDPGDGSLFTRTIPGSDEYEALGFGGNALLSPTASISGDGDSLLSLSGRYSVDSVEGPFYISNRKLPLCMDTIFSVGRRLVCEASDVAAGRHLVVTGALDFAEGSAVSVEPGLGDFPAGAGYVLAESTEAITGLPVLDTPTGPREVLVSVSGDGRKLLMDVKVYGTVISVR